MLPDLGKYAVPVLMAYGISLVLILGLVVQSLRQAAVVRARLRAAEGNKESPYG